MHHGRWRALSGAARPLASTPPCCSWDSASYADKNCARDVGSLIAPLQRALALLWRRRARSCRRRQRLRVQRVARAAALDAVGERTGLATPVGAKSFCRTLGARKLLFLGDSVMQQLAAVAMNAVAWDDGICAHQLVFGASDTLSTRAWAHRIAASTGCAGLTPSRPTWLCSARRRTSVTAISAASSRKWRAARACAATR